MTYDADVIVIGAGLAGLVATAELVDAGRKVILLDQEPEQSLGGQAHWSFGGLFFVGSPEQRRMRIKDSRELALQDWYGTAGFDREEDAWPRRWAEAYVDFAAGEKRPWLHAQGVRFFPVVGWAERGGYDANGHGNSVPPLPHHLGHRPRPGRALRTPGPRRSGPRPGPAPLPPPGHRPRTHRRRPGHRDGRGPRPLRRRTGYRERPREHRGVLPPGPVR
ncbi:hypothetical protein GCM10020254_65210 [Streptomyces goshikiensis]